MVAVVVSVSRKAQSGRRSPRRAISADGSIVRREARPVLCRLENISYHGAGLKTFDLFEAGAAVTLHIRYMPPMRASIVWSDDFAAGLQFERPLTAEEMTFLVETFAVPRIEAAA
ncbi:PilZ domain-containing protein [Sphingomonas guangdongensis]|uniref:PilZ domain-containing protein n=2 Tax=Sphingomonas guangdongensis TaxID=1141890 RepID=A0A285QG20_9SPHN|nr:PilZ domain-containing protein [Sphingomonas guangdongensis]